MIYDRLFLLDAVEHYKDRTETATKPLAAFLLGEKKICGQCATLIAE